jgi:hypothetical protein
LIPCDSAQLCIDAEDTGGTEPITSCDDTEILKLVGVLCFNKVRFPFSKFSAKVEVETNFTISTVATIGKKTSGSLLSEPWKKKYKNITNSLTLNS